MYEAVDGTRIGKKIKELRLQKKMTAEDLAKALGISASAVIMYEAGNRIPRDEIKIKIADFFDCSIESIFYSIK